jgi:plasmid replication initiation protein
MIGNDELYKRQGCFLNKEHKTGFSVLISFVWTSWHNLANSNAVVTILPSFGCSVYSCVNNQKSMNMNMK